MALCSLSVLTLLPFLYFSTLIRRNLDSDTRIEVEGRGLTGVEVERTIRVGIVNKQSFEMVDADGVLSSSARITTEIER